MSVKTRVRVTSETVVDDTEIQNQRYRTRRIHKVSEEVVVWVWRERIGYNYGEDFYNTLQDTGWVEGEGDLVR